MFIVISAFIRPSIYYIIIIIIEQENIPFSRTQQLLPLLFADDRVDNIKHRRQLAGSCG